MRTARLAGLSGFRLALREDFHRGYCRRRSALFGAAARYKRSGGKPGQRCSVAVCDRICELTHTARWLWLDYCAAQDAGDREGAKRQCRRVLSAALVLAQSMEGIGDARC